MLQRISLRRLSVAVIVLVVLTRVPALSYSDAINAESYNSIVANEMLHGGLPYQDAVDRKPPLLYVVYWGIYRLTGFPNWPALHLVALGGTLAIMGLLFALGHRRFTPLAGYSFGAPESWDPCVDTSNRIAPGAWDSLPLDSARHPPRYIVAADRAPSIPRYPMARFPYLAQLVDAHGQLEFRGPDGLVYGRRP